MITQLPPGRRGGSIQLDLICDTPSAPNSTSLSVIAPLSIFVEIDLPALASGQSDAAVSSQSCATFSSMIAVGRAIVELGRARALVFGYGLGVLETVAPHSRVWPSCRSASLRGFPCCPKSSRREQVHSARRPRMLHPSTVPAATRGLALIDPAKRGSPAAVRDNTDGLVDSLSGSN